MVGFIALTDLIALTITCDAALTVSLFPSSFFLSFALLVQGSVHHLHCVPEFRPRRRRLAGHHNGGAVTVSTITLV